MKKLISIFLLVAMLISVIPCVALSAAADGETITPDTSWYDNDTTNASASTFEIDTAAKLLGYAKLMNENKRAFVGDTVKLTADIDLNPGWDANNFTEAPANVWPQIEQDQGGVFDGQGHIIRGVYQVSDAENMSGIFGRNWGRVSAVKNVRFENCYSESSASKGHGFLYGAITNAAKVTIENVYVDARIVNTGVGNQSDAVGGLVGIVPWDGGTTFEMTNTVFAGTIEVAPTNDTTFMVLGGLIGTVNIKATKIENCASYATFKGTKTKDDSVVIVGGYIGYDAAATNPVTVNNSISACTNEIVGAVCGSIIGAGRYNADKTHANIVGAGNVTASDANDVGCAWHHSTPSTTYTSGDEYNAVCPAADFVEYDADISDNFATVLHGYQAKDAVDDTFDFRLVATVDVPENVTVDKVGFVITAKYGTTTLTKNYSTNTVYNSVTGNTDTGLEEYTAEALGGDYIFALAITGAPVLAEGAITLEVTTYYVSGTTTVYGAPEVFTVTAPQDALN